MIVGFLRLRLASLLQASALFCALWFVTDKWQEVK